MNVQRLTAGVLMASTLVATPASAFADTATPAPSPTTTAAAPKLTCGDNYALSTQLKSEKDSATFLGNGLLKKKPVKDDYMNLQLPQGFTPKDGENAKGDLLSGDKKLGTFEVKKNGRVEGMTQDVYLAKLSFANATEAQSCAPFSLSIPGSFKDTQQVLKEQQDNQQQEQNNTASSPWGWVLLGLLVLALLALLDFLLRRRKKNPREMKSPPPEGGGTHTAER